MPSRELRLSWGSRISPPRECRSLSLPADSRLIRALTSTWKWKPHARGDSFRLETRRPALVICPGDSSAGLKKKKKKKKRKKKKRKEPAKRNATRAGSKRRLRPLDSPESTRGGKWTRRRPTPSRPFFNYSFIDLYLSTSGLRFPSVFSFLL
jgi:hypothetical protein